MKVTAQQILDHCKAIVEGSTNPASEAEVKPHYEGGYIVHRLGYFAIVKEGMHILDLERAAMFLGIDLEPAPLLLVAPSPNWSKDSNRMQALISPLSDLSDGDWCIHGFHPKYGHCLIGRSYSFDQDAVSGFTFLSKGETLEFGSAKKIAKWCKSQKVEFLDPHNAYKDLGETE